MIHRHLPLPVLLVLVALIPVTLAVAWLPAALHPGPATGRVYTVAQILDATGRNPRAWDGRTVRVRGAIQPDLLLVRDSPRPPSVTLAAPALGYVPLADTGAAVSALWVTHRPDDGLVALLHRLPVAGALVPGPRAPRMGATATYRVQLHVDTALCASPRCVVGTLLDFTALALGDSYAPADPLNHAAP